MGIKGNGGIKKGGGLGNAVMLNGGDALSAGSNFGVGGGGGGGGTAGGSSSSSSSQQGSLTKITETETKTETEEISSTSSDTFGFQSLGQVLETSGRKKRDALMRKKRALPDPAHGSSSSAINKRE